MKYTLAMFDFDGTLADTFPWFLSAVTRLAEKHGFNKIEAGEVETLRGYSAHKIVEHLGIPAWKLPRIGIDMRRMMAEDIRQIRSFEGIGAMLRGLSDRGVALAVVTSNAYDNVRHVLGAEHAALIRYYECGASLFGKRGKLRRVLKQSGVRPVRRSSLATKSGISRPPGQKVSPSAPLRGATRMWRRWRTMRRQRCSPTSARSSRRLA